MPESRQKVGQFLPGTSGNPGGRPAKTQAKKDRKDMLRRALPEAVEAVIRIINEPGRG